MGFSIAGAGHVAAGMADMEGQLAQNKFRHQLNEQMASQVRQQQEREAFERMARRNIQAPQWNLGNLPQGQMQNQPAAAPAAPEQVSDRNENYGNEGRSKPAPTELERLQAEKAQYERLLKGAQTAGPEVIPSTKPMNVVNTHTLFAPWSSYARPEAATVTNYNKFGGEQRGQAPSGAAVNSRDAEIAGYKQGIAQYDELINAQRGKDAKAAHAKIMAESPSLQAAVRHVESRGNMNAVSPKGAKSDMQVMDATNASPGFGVSPAQNGTLEERSRVGKDYLAAMQKRYGNDVHALVAYNWGPGNADKWIASGADVNKLPAETRKYVADVQAQMGGAQPQQTAAAPQQEAPAQNLTGQATVMSGPNYDLGMQQLKQQYDYLATVMQNTFDSQQRLQILGQMQQLQQKGQEMQIERVGQAAQFNPEALQQLVSFMAGRVGQPIGVVTDGKGRAQLVRQDGQPIQGQWGQQMPVATLVDGILNNLIPSRAAANSADAAVRSKAMAESTGKAVGDMQVETVKGQYGLAREQMQGLSMAVITQAKEAAHNGRWGQAVPDGMGGFIAARPDGTFVHSLAPVTDKSGKVSTPQPRVITFDQLNAGMIPRG